MTVFIKDMKMPVSCSQCRFNSGCDGCEGYENHCTATENYTCIGYNRDSYGKIVPENVEITPTDHRHECCPLIEVELIHCKDCKNYSGDGMYCGWNMIARADGYCFHANEKPVYEDD